MSLPPFSGAATLAVLAGGCVAMVAGAVGGRPADDRVARASVRDVAPWAAVAGVVALWQLAAYLQEPRHEHPTLSSMANALLDSHPARTVACALWLLAAWALARR
ncbi:MAG: hypothetical protein ACLGI2_11115 [Acidimicrobiia bacterium]